MKTYEVNFDGLVGNTHNYAGLAIGDKASMQHAFSISHPKEAALQGLGKMKLLMDLGLKQAVLPPQPRPAIPFLKSLGFKGNDPAMILKKAYEADPHLFLACYSASGMWTANAASVSPSVDTLDEKVHITPANLSANLHRSLESPVTTRVLQCIFADPQFFVVHEPLANGYTFSDEGAANHSRLCVDYDQKGVSLFVYGKVVFNAQGTLPKKFPARQALEASQAIARLHQLNPSRVIFAQQNPAVIDCGVFHNDVISVANQQVFLYHERAFLETEKIISALEHAMQGALIPIKITEKELSVEKAVACYLFNSQLISLPNQEMALIVPQECETSHAARHVLERVMADNNPIKSLHFVDCHQSMQNGGGPACLRLRVVLTEAQIQQMHQGVYLTDALYLQLVNFVKKHYRDELKFNDLFSSDLFLESQQALLELEKILNLPGLYDGFFEF